MPTFQDLFNLLFISVQFTVGCRKVIAYPLWRFFCEYYGSKQSFLIFFLYIHLLFSSGYSNYSITSFSLLLSQGNELLYSIASSSSSLEICQNSIFGFSADKIRRSSNYLFIHGNLECSWRIWRSSSCTYRRKRLEGLIGTGNTSK